jgi:hypothetical protein
VEKKKKKKKSPNPSHSAVNKHSRVRTRAPCSIVVWNIEAGRHALVNTAHLHRHSAGMTFSTVPTVPIANILIISAHKVHLLYNVNRGSKSSTVLHEHR